MTAMATTFPVSESGSLVMSGFPASLSATRTSTRRSRRGALNDGGCHPPSEARPWRPEISATALQIIADEDTLVETRRSWGADVTCAETAVRVRSDGAAWRGLTRSGWEVLRTNGVVRQKRERRGRLSRCPGTKVLRSQNQIFCKLLLLSAPPKN